MESAATILFRFRGTVAIKRWSAGINYVMLIKFIWSKWAMINGRNLTLTYKMDVFDECILQDDEDVTSMFLLMKDLNVRHVEVTVKEAEGGSAPVNNCNALQVAQPLVSLFQYDRNVVVAEQQNTHVIQPLGGKRLLSAEWANLIKDAGQAFVGGADEFRKSLVKFSIEIGFEYVYVKNESSRVTAECRFKHDKQCAWRIHASIDKANNNFYIRKYDKHHSCGMFFGTASKKRLTSNIIIELIDGYIRSMPAITPRDIQAQIKENYGIDISYYVSWRATDGGRNKIFGDHSTSFSYLPEYFREAERTNPGSIFHLEVDDVKNIFRRCFFAFGACLVGFKICRPVVMIDGTFLKGKHGGILLSAVGKDGDEGLYSNFF
ncbi:PREDICTED: uncharacterized protein LOC105976877 [Erythranthe guttata]|uniref:uncharacterized protein LOC105976877 n=1 Tax=Erythranthe guttata TaxID=4155 RepID=UPI00064D79E8|nr:PREDICTED: uncharacterized protein LOC105976877 [Erythranthe guttata]|eukprot:XP_012857593.1 PREDICTED: uncharacterized protein LOC105976877 [Erythranthe guttata]